MGAETSVAAVALVVSLIALLVTLIQLLQQVFGTAEGYRRCQESIIGPWASLRKRKIRWGELRMETQFMTPDFFLLRDDDRRMKQRDIHQFVPRSHLVPLRENFRKGQVGWLGLLSSLYDLEQNYSSYGLPPVSHMYVKPLVSKRRSSPVFQSLSQSWDLMPPDVIRPLATTTLGNIIVLAHRLGMDWSAVRPSDGRLHAEGHGQSFTSVEIRSLGLALQYTDKDPQSEKTGDYFTAPTNRFEGSRSLSRLFIPSSAADKMAFGFIPGDPDLDTQEYCIAAGTRRFDGIEETMLQLKVKWGAMAYCTRGLAGQNFFNDTFKTPMWNGISDAIYLLPPWLPLPNSGAVRVRLPHHADLQTPLNWREGQVVFWLRLKRLALEPTSMPPQLRKLLSHLEKLATQYPNNFIHLDNLPHKWKSHYNTTLTTEKGLAVLKEMYDDCVAFLKCRSFAYTDLVASHIEMAVDAHKKVLAMPDQEYRKCGELSGFYYVWMVEQAHQYVDNIEVVQKSMRSKDPSLQPDDIRDTWWTMIAKGIIWSFSIQPHGGHSWQAYTPIPSHYWENDLPIYIT